MTRVSRGDLAAGVLAAALGAAVLLYVRGFPELPDGSPGPALFPGIIGGLLVLFGLVLVARSLRAGHRATADVPPAGGEADGDEPVPPSTTTGRLNALFVLGSVVAYLLLVDLLGFAITMGVILFALMWRLGAKPLVALAAAVVTTGLIVLIFQRLLLVPLPTGPLG
jgi:putative tricarboxylic transport membrane protein